MVSLTMVVMTTVAIVTHLQREALVSGGHESEGQVGYKPDNESGHQTYPGRAEPNTVQ